MNKISQHKVYRHKITKDYKSSNLITRQERTTPPKTKEKCRKRQEGKNIINTRVEPNALEYMSKDHGDLKYVNRLRLRLRFEKLYDVHLKSELQPQC